MPMMSRTGRRVRSAWLGKVVGGKQGMPFFGEEIRCVKTETKMGDRGGKKSCPVKIHSNDPVPLRVRVLWMLHSNG